MESMEKTAKMVPKHHNLKLRLTDAIVELCRKEAFYIEELRIEGTVCLVSDRSSVLIAQITEQIGNQESGEPRDLPKLNKDQASYSSPSPSTEKNSGVEVQASGSIDDVSDAQNARSRLSKKGHRNKYQCPFCSKSYAFKHGMKDHMNIHLGRKPHVCKLCLMPFAHVGSMCGHMKRDHYHQLCHNHSPNEGSRQNQSVKTCNNPPTHCACERSQSQRKDIEVSSIKGLQTRARSENSMDMDRISLPTTESIENIKQELSSTEGDPSEEAAVGEKDSENIMDVQNFLQQFESEKDQQAGHSQQMGLTSQGQRVNEGHLLGQQPGLTPVTSLTSDLIHTLNMSQAAGHLSSQPGQLPAVRWDNPLAAVGGISTNVTPVSVPLNPQAQGLAALPSPTLEMLAHMAQLAQGTQFPAAVSELSQVLTAQQRAVTTATASGPRLRMPPPASLQRSPDGKFQCPFCEKTYNFKHTLKDHINKHMGNRPHVCKHCGDSFTHLASLCAHIKRRHDSQMTSDYQCELCHEKFMNLQSLKQHFTWRHKDIKFSPQKFLECSRGVVGPEGESQNNPAQQQQPTALLSPAYSVASGSLTKLPSTHSSVSSSLSSPMVCASLPSPITTTQGGGTPQSVTNALSSPLPTNLLSPHPTGATSTRLTDQCLFPPNSTISPKNECLSEKISEEQTAAATLSNQPQFPGTFVYPSNQSCHDNNQTRQEMVAVTAPTRSLSEEENLSLTTHIADYFSEVNLQTEQGLYKYKCKICGNLFKIRNSLYEHLNSHLGKKPYVCAVCGDAFTHHSSLHNHTRNKHSQQSRQEREAQFRHGCGVCGKKFRFPSELDRHFKTNPDHDIRQTPASMV